MPSSSLQLVPTASADDLRAAAPAARRSTDDEDSDDEPDLTHECFKLMVLVGLIVALVLLNKEVGAALLTMKNWLLKHIPLYAYFLGYVAVQGCRRLLPPLYYAMPIGLLTIFYLVARLGWLRAGFLYQAWQMLDCVWFVGIRYVYTDKVALVLDKSREGKKIRRYLPRDVVRLLRVLDKEWKRRISQGEYSVAWRVATVALLGSAYGCDEMVTLYFLATRCDASLAFFAVAWLATQLLQLPSALVRAYTVQSFVGASAAVWKPNSDERHRADAGMEATSRRWRGIYTLSSRCSYGDDVASMAWGVRRFISTQVGGGRLGHPRQRLPESARRSGCGLGRGRGRGHRRGPLGALQVALGARALEPAFPADGAPRGDH